MTSVLVVVILTLVFGLFSVGECQVIPKSQPPIRIPETPPTISHELTERFARQMGITERMGIQLDAHENDIRQSRTEIRTLEKRVEFLNGMLEMGKFLLAGLVVAVVYPIVKEYWVPKRRNTIPE